MTVMYICALNCYTHTCEVGPWDLQRDSGKVFNSALELKVQRKRIPLLGLAFTVQLMEAISPWATPQTIFWSAPQTGLSRMNNIEFIHKKFFMLTHVGLHQRGNKLKAYAKVHTSFLLSTRQQQESSLARKIL